MAIEFSGNLPIDEIREAMVTGGVVLIDGYSLVVVKGGLEFSFKNAGGRDCIAFNLEEGDALEISSYYYYTKKTACPEMPSHSWFFAFIKELAIALELEEVILLDESSKSFKNCDHVDKSIFRIAAGKFFYSRYGFIYDKKLEQFYETLKQKTLLDLALSCFTEIELTREMGTFKSFIQGEPAPHYDAADYARRNALNCIVDAVVHQLPTGLDFFEAFGDRALQTCLVEFFPEKDFLPVLCNDFIGFCKSDDIDDMSLKIANDHLSVITALVRYSTEVLNILDHGATWRVPVKRQKRGGHTKRFFRKRSKKKNRARKTRRR